MVNTDDLTAKITEMLNNPDEMEQIKAMAQSLMQGGDTQNAGGQNPQSGNDFPPFSADGLGDIADIGSIMNVLKLLKNSGTDNRSNLLMALKPHLAPERRERVDKAVKILKLVSLVPILKQQGILDF